MTVGCLLTLSDGTEREYWADAGTQRQLRRVDCLGLAAGVVLNLLDAGYEGSGRTRRRVRVACAGLLQLMQLAWLLLKPQSYMRHRVCITFIQRLRWCLVCFVGLGMGLGAAEPALIDTYVPIQRPLQPGSLLAFLWVVCAVPV
jgi:hypothetical protein